MDKFPAKAIAANRGGHVQEIAANPAVPRRRRQIARIPGNGAQIAAMTGQALKLEANAPHSLRVFIQGAKAKHSFPQHALGGGIGNGFIAGHTFHQAQTQMVRRGCRGQFEQHSLHAAMLVAEGNFKIEHIFAITLKTKMPGLDDAGMDWPNANLVRLAALDAVKAVIGIAAFAWRVGNYAHGLEPGMMPGHYAAVFVNFALKKLGLGAEPGNGIKFRNAFGPERAKLAVSRQHGIKLAPALPHSEKRKQPPVAIYVFRKLAGEVRQNGDVLHAGSFVRIKNQVLQAGLPQARLLCQDTARASPVSRCPGQEQSGPELPAAQRSRPVRAFCAGLPAYPRAWNPEPCAERPPKGRQR